jgi:restriction system protein
MPIPKFQEILLPLLKKFSDKQEHHRNDFVDILADDFKLTNEEKTIKIKAGSTQFSSRVHWALTFLKHSNLLQSTKRGYYTITDNGLKILSSDYNELTVKILIQTFPELNETPFWNNKLRKNGDVENERVSDSEFTPEENIEQNVAQIESSVILQLLDSVKKLKPIQFENLVVRLLVAMNYGTGMVTNYTNDAGVDGIIQADELGLDKIYVQAKKYEANVGRPDIQKFVGAMTGTNKGVFITTSDYSNSVQEYLNTRQENVILINGEKLVQLMYEYNQGVTIRKNIEIKAIDNDYFDEL